MRRTIYIFSTLMCGFWGSAQTDTAWRTEIKSPNERVWQRVSQVPEATGGIRAKTNTIHEIGTGLAYWDGTQYQPSREVLEVIGNEAIGIEAPHKLILNGDANVQGSLDVELPNGAGRLTSTVLGINLYDPKSASSMLIAELRDAQGEFEVPNRVIYPSAMDTIQAEVSVSFHKWGIEQFVTLQERFDLPNGFDPETTMIEVWTEFFNPPTPRITKKVTDGVENAFVDFGSMQMGPAGKAFTANLPGTEKWTTLVFKSWHVIEGRTFLVEAVRWKDAARYIAQLPQGNGQAALEKKVAQFAKRDLRKGDLPIRQFAKKSEDKLRYAAVDRRTPGLVVDFSLVTTTNMVLEGGKTWFVSSPVTLSNLVIEATAVVKYTNNAYIDVLNSVETRTEPYAPAVFTSMYDAAVGETISTNASPAQEASAGLILSGTGNTLEYVRFSHMESGIILLWADATLKHAVFTRSGNGVEVYGGQAKVLNGLFFDIGDVVDGMDYAFIGEHLTIDDASRISGVGGTNATYLTNSIAANLTQLGDGPFYTNKFVRSADNSCFKTVGASGHYLADNSAYRDAGVATSIEPELRTRTTYGPIVHAYQTMITNQDVTLATTAPRDADSLPDLGWHPCAVDHVFGSSFASNSVITVKPGTAIATYSSAPYAYGLMIWRGGKLVCEGSPLEPVRIVRFDAVQELANTNWSGTPGPCVILSYDSEGRFRFTEFTVMAADTEHINDEQHTVTSAMLRATDCQFNGGTVYTGGPFNFLTNCLFQRTSLFIIGRDGATVTNILQNNLFIGGDFLGINYTNSDLVLHDNLFDRTSLMVNMNVIGSHNGYITNYYRLPPNGTGDVILTNVTYERGPLGRYYLPAGSPLVDAGSVTNAGSKGFHWHTSLTNQTLEASSRLNIGKLWIAVTNGVALDSDGDGSANYLEDANGDGMKDTSETDSASTDTDGDGVSDYLETIQGRNPLVNGTVSDSGNAIKLRVHTPLK